MKKNHRKEYVTRDYGAGGLDFRTIADLMTASGDPMGHSTARNHVGRMMERLACTFMVDSGVTGDPAEIARSPGFQKRVETLVHEVYAEMVQADKLA